MIFERAVPLVVLSLFIVGCMVFAVTISDGGHTDSVSSVSVLASLDDYDAAEKAIQDANNEIKSIVASVKPNKEVAKSLDTSKYRQKLDEDLAKSELKMAHSKEKTNGQKLQAIINKKKSIILAAKPKKASKKIKKTAKNSNNAVASSSPFDRSVRNGVWKPDGKNPPYIPKVLMYAGAGVNIGLADVLRKWFGFKLSWRDRRWDGRRYLESFEGNHFRFVARSQNGRLIFPPLSGPVPELSNEAGRLLANFVKVGGNSLIVCGGPQAVLFLNSILPWLGYSGDLMARWREGPFEKQTPALHSRFLRSPVMLPGDDAWGVTVDSLPQTAVSYYEAPGVSVVFSLPVQSGQIVYVGSSFAGQYPQWKDVLMAAAKTTPERLIDI